MRKRGYKTGGPGFEKEFFLENETSRGEIQHNCPIYVIFFKIVTLAY